MLYTGPRQTECAVALVYGMEDTSGHDDAGEIALRAFPGDLRPPSL